MENFIKNQRLNSDIELFLIQKINKYPHSAIERFYQTFDQHVRIAQQEVSRKVRQKEK